MSDWESCDDGDLCDDGYVCDDDSYGHCEEKFPTVFWVFQLVFIGFFILWCAWAGYICNKENKEKAASEPAAQPQPQQPQQQPIKQHEIAPSNTYDENNGDLPDGWVKCVTSDGRTYYQNNTTKETQWERPVVIISTPPPTYSNELPPGWIELRTDDGKVYYQHNASKTTQWERPVILQTAAPTNTIIPETTTAPAPSTNTNDNVNAIELGQFEPFLEFPFSTTCRNYLIRLLMLFACMASFFLAYFVPSCCSDFYDSDYDDPDCCSWYWTNYLIYIFSWILFVWYCLAGLYLVLVKKETMTWVSSSTQNQGNYQVTTTTVSTSSNVCYNSCMLAVNIGILLFAMVIVPAVLGDDCDNHYC